SVINTDGRGAATDGSAPFNGQVFFNPAPGTIGTLQRRQFSGPWNTGYDMAATKSFRFNERHTVLLRAEGFNIFNHPTFYVGSETKTPPRFLVDKNKVGGIGTTVFHPR